MDDENKDVDTKVEETMVIKNEDKPVETKSFTQEEVTGFVAKEAKKAQEKLFKQLGLGEDINSVQDGLTKYNEWVDKQKSEIDKANDAVKKAETDRVDFESKLSILQMENACLKCGVAPDAISDVALLAGRLIDDTTDAKTAIEKILEKYPQFSQVDKQEAPNKPIFSTKGQKSDAPANALDEVRKLMGLK